MIKDILLDICIGLFLGCVCVVICVGFFVMYIKFFGEGVIIEDSYVNEVVVYE